MTESRPKHFIREWRQFRKMSLDDLAASVPMDKGNLSKMERGILPYGQDNLERIAIVLNIEVDQLLRRNPTEPTPIWDYIGKASPTVRRQIEEAAAAIYRAAQER